MTSVPVMFGLNITPSVGPGCDPIRDALIAEQLGFDFVSANDHVHGTSPRFEAWTMLSWIAARTSRIRIAPRVLGVPYRNPAVMAKMAETFDRLSGGRLILGLGAGSAEEEFRALGLPVRPLRQRITGLEEAIRIMRGMWAGPAYTFDGEFYRTEAAELEPKPDHLIPIWLGTHGPRGLELTGRLADGWIPSLELAPPEQAPTMLRRIFRAAQDVGRDPSDIRTTYNVQVRVDGRQDVNSFVVAGTIPAVAERLSGFLRLGFNALNLITLGPDREQQVERLGREVLPAVRQTL